MSILTPSHLPRLIQGEELQHFITSNRSPGQRESWIRSELNLIYPGEYTIAKVAERINLTPQGLRKLENEDEARPRQSTLIAMAELYQISSDVLTSDSIEPFFLGGPISEINRSDIRGPQYKLSISATLLRPDGNVEERSLISNLMLRHLDYEEICEMNIMMEKWIRNRLIKQQKLDEAYDTLTRKANSLESE